MGPGAQPSSLTNRVKMLLSLAIYVKNLHPGFMIMKRTSLYDNAHLVVAAIRILEHRHSAPPTVEEVCGLLSLSVEQGGYICRKLGALDVIHTVAGAYQDRLVISDHTKIESIPKDAAPDELRKEIEKFQRTQRDQNDKIKAIQAAQKKKKKTLFAEMEEKLKKELDKR